MNIKETRQQNQGTSGEDHVNLEETYGALPRLGSV